MAVDGAQLECVKMLLEAGADVNAVSLGGLTALHIACRNDSIPVIELLLSQKGVATDVESSERATADMVTRNPVIIEKVKLYRSSSLAQMT